MRLLSRSFLGLVLSTGLGWNALAQDASPAESAPAQPAAPATPAPQEKEADNSLDAILAGLRENNTSSATSLAAREEKFQQRLNASEKRLADARATIAAREATGRQLERRFDSNKVELNDKAALLTDKIGALKELFGVFQQNASDLIGAFVSSPTSIQYPDRDRWLEGFANRMKNASEVSSADDIKTLWFEMLREINATGDIVRLRAPVKGRDGSMDDRDVIRVGTFNLISTEPEPSYLAWRVGGQQVVEMPRQPTGPYAAEIEQYIHGDDELGLLSVDPTAGVLLSLLIEKPTQREQVDQGGLVGYMIVALGGIALLLALLKLIDISIISLRVGSQMRNLAEPSGGNSLGRLLLVYAENRHVDAETLEMRLHERVEKESARVNRFTIFLAIIAAVTPLMGLLGTVVGMINTFQAITLYGTGDPQTMAGGISQALITTVLGLIVAVPAVLLHAIVSARGKAVVNVLRQQSATLTGDRLEAQAAGEHDTAVAPMTLQGAPA